MSLLLLHIDREPRLYLNANSVSLDVFLPTSLPLPLTGCEANADSIIWTASSRTTQKGLFVETFERLSSLRKTKYLFANIHSQKNMSETRRRFLRSRKNWDFLYTFCYQVRVRARWSWPVLGRCCCLCGRRSWEGWRKLAESCATALITIFCEKKINRYTYMRKWDKHEMIIYT